MSLAELERPVPGLARMGNEALVRAACLVERHRGGLNLLVSDRGAVGRPAVIANDPQHVLAVLLKARERAKLLRHLGRGRIGGAGHDRCERCGNRAARVAVIGNAARHEEPADIGKAQAKRAEIIREPGNLLRRKLRHHHRNFEHDRPQSHCMRESLEIESPDICGGGWRGRVSELQ